MEIPTSVLGRKLLAAHPLFAALSPSELDQLGQFLHLKVASKGSAIFRKGDPGACLMIVVEGAVKVVAPANDGKEVLLNVLGQGGVLGEIALLDGQPRTADAIALADCRLLTLDRRDLLPFIERNPRVALELISVLCGKLRRTSEHVEGVMFLSVAARIARALQRLRRGTSDEIDLTQQELGQTTGCTRESVNHELRRWQAKGWIRLQKGRIAILRDDIIDKLAT